MTRRTTEIYADVFRFIEKKILKLKPAEFITDFEAAMRKAIRLRYRKAILRGCWYHYSAAIRKKMVKLNLLGLMKHNKNARTIKVMIQGLPLLPPECFMQGYEHVKHLARKWNLFTKFKKFFSYFQYFWVAEVSGVFFEYFQFYFRGKIPFSIIHTRMNETRYLYLGSTCEQHLHLNL